MGYFPSTLTPSYIQYFRNYLESSHTILSDELIHICLLSALDSTQGILPTGYFEVLEKTIQENAFHCSGLFHCRRLIFEAFYMKLKEIELSSLEQTPEAAWIHLILPPSKITFSTMWNTPW